MKKIWIGLVILLCVSFVMSIGSPDVPVGSSEVENVEGIIEDYSPLDDSGNVNIEKYKPVLTKAEVRIGEINLWLENNAKWLKVVFGMVPSITWLFAINFYVLVFFLDGLIVSGDMLGIPGKKIDLLLFEVSSGNLLGLALFVGLLVTKIFVKLSVFINELLSVFWNYILPFGFAVAVIIMIVAAVLSIFLLFYIPKILSMIKKRREGKKEKDEKKKESTNRKVLEKITARIDKA